jgi:HEAT repeat protein
MPTEEPGSVSAREKLTFYIVQAIIIFLLLAFVLLAWLLTRNQGITAAALFVAVLTRIILDSAIPIILDRFRRGRFASRYLSSLRRGDANVRLQAVAGLLWLGNDAAKIINSARKLRLPESVESEAQRELDKYVLPGLALAARDGDPSVRLAAVHALEEIRSRRPLLGIM